MAKTDLEKANAEALANIAYEPRTDNPKDLSNVDFTEPNQADVSKKAVVRLGQFLNSYVDNGRRENGKNNQFRPPQTTGVASSGHRGSDIRPLPSAESGAVTFMQQDQMKDINSSGLGVGSRLGTFFEAEQVEKLVNKTANKSGAGKSGHNLLSEIDGNDVVTPHPGDKPQYPTLSSADADSYNDFLINQLAKANLYHPSADATFILDPDAAARGHEELATHGLFTIQRNLGEFDHNGQRVKVSDMSRMAISLLARANGDDAAAEVFLSGGTISAALKSALNIDEKLGIRGVNVRKLQLNGLKSPNFLKSIMDGATGNEDFLARETSTSLGSRNAPPDGSTDRPLFQSSPYNSVSYGQLNSFLVPFGSAGGSFGMLAVAVAGIASLLALSIVIDAMSGLAGDPTKSSYYIDPKKPYLYAYGSHSKNDTNIDKFINTVVFDLLRVTKTDYDFGDCVSQGIALLLGFSPSGGVENVALQIANVSSLANFALNLVMTPSYYANMFRQITRDVNELIGAFQELNGATTSGYTEAFHAVEKMIASKPYRFIMIAAGVGDAAIKSAKGYPGINDGGRLSSKGDAPPVPARKTGLGGLTNRLQSSRWADGRNQVSLTTFPAVRIEIPGAEPYSAGLRTFSLSPSQDNVKEVEAALEADYVPFYFHDLRTHEIFSLPAFITDFSEAFNVNYGSIKGFGRQDAVKLYTDAERTMTFSFKLVSFNEKDFDEMWYMVNRLVAMCYPQYSKGRDRSFTDDQSREFKFTQPFSQIPAASPLIRLRLGDVLKSNYTNSNLRRFFGNVTMNVDTQAAQDKLEKARESEYKKLFEAVDTALLSGNLLGAKAVAKYCKLKNSASYELLASEFEKKEILRTYGQIGSNLLFLDSGILSVGDLNFEIKYVMPHNDKFLIATVQEIAENGSPGYAKPFNVKITARDFEKSKTVSAKSEVEAESSVQEAKAALNKMTVTAAQETSAREEFFKPENNAIVRSFESTSGKGMAGVITSLGLGYTQAQWSLTPGSKAPMMIDIALGFSPIHDLPLGLDHNGHMRAASHPVGKTMGAMGSVYRNEK